MIWVILAIIAGLIAVGFLIYAFKAQEGTALIGAIIAALVGGGLIFAGSFYTQGVAEAKVLVNYDGTVVGSDITEGAAFKSPLVHTETFDTKNQQVIFAKPTDSQPNPNGGEITVQDREGVTANIDIGMRYSIDPEKVVEIYKKYQSQENFVSRFIETDIKAAVRNVPANYGTLELLNSRAKVENDIVTYLSERWEGKGVVIESVSLQEIRYSDEVKGRFDSAQAARIEVEKAQADLDATEVSAQQQIVQAEAAAEANRLLSESLTPEVLEQNRLDTLRSIGEKGNLIVVPDGSTPFVQVQK